MGVGVGVGVCVCVCVCVNKAPLLISLNPPNTVINIFCTVFSYRSFNLGTCVLRCDCMLSIPLQRRSRSRVHAVPCSAPSMTCTSTRRMGIGRHAH